MRKIAITGILFLLAACSTGDPNFDDFNRMYGNGTDDAGILIEKVSNLKVYFGHQSVGRNILGGIEAWENESGVPLEIAETRDFSSVPDAPLVHFSVGSNGDLRGKVDDFVSLMATIPTEEEPIAMFKFCYVDITSETSVESEFAYLQEKMINLQEEYPNIKFIACTVPYTGISKGPKALVKKVLGRAPYGVLENMKRYEFNQRILNDLSKEMPVFDLAALESTNPDGGKATFKYKGESYPLLPEYYRSDFGHLNDFGAKTVSYNFLAFLADR